MISVTKLGRIAYIVLPDIEFLRDKTWMTSFDFAHHICEYKSSFIFAKIHDRAYLEASSTAIDDPNQHASLSSKYRSAVKSDNIPDQYRFLHHKHNYRLGGWIELIEETRRFLGARFEIVDARYGHERMDCHFVLKRVLQREP